MNTYTFSLTIAKKSLSTLLTLIAKGEAYAKEKGIEESMLLNASLALDMFSFTKQVQVATDDARRNFLFLAGREHIRFEDTEKSFSELRERVNKSIAVLDTLTEADFAEADSRKVSLFWMGQKYVEGKDFVQEFALANLFFHVVTAYGILRKEGVDLGKVDFIGMLSMKD